MYQIDIPNTLRLQSPYLYCQAAGSDGSDDTNPGAHLRWDLGDRAQMRLSAARTVRRPSWDQLNPTLLIDDEESIEGVRCVAAPVFDFGGRLAGAVSLLAPSMRVDLPRLLELGARTADAAQALSHQLGNHDAPGPIGTVG